MHILSDQNFETRRAILFRLRHRHCPEVLLEVNGTLHVLPEVRITRSDRIVEQLTTAVKEVCGVDVVSLHAAKSGSTGRSYEVLEAYDAHAEAPSGCKWVAVYSLVTSSFGDVTDFDAVRQALESTAPSRSSRGPFSTLGWFPLLEQWAQNEIEGHGLRLTGTYRQFNASPTFSLIRFATDGAAVWFKAVGEPNLREYSLTLALADFNSPFVPRFISARPEWSGWLAFEAAGTRLSEVSNPLAWAAAAQDLAGLQIESIGASQHLLEANARDLRTSAMRDRVEPFFDYMAVLMRQQAQMPPPPALSHKQLQELSQTIGEGMVALDETRTPQTLGHLDLHAENIMCSSVSTVFLDRAEGFVGHPFLTFEYYIETFRRRFGIGHALEARVIESYCTPWHAIVSDQSIRQALEVAPLVAVFAFATANETWNNPRWIEEKDTSAYMRSLTRRMNREARLSSEWRLSCPR